MAKRKPEYSHEVSMFDSHLKRARIEAQDCAEANLFALLPSEIFERELLAPCLDPLARFLLALTCRYNLNFYLKSSLNSLKRYRGVNLICECVASTFPCLVEWSLNFVDLVGPYFDREILASLISAGNMENILYCINVRKSLVNLAAYKIYLSQYPDAFSLAARFGHIEVAEFTLTLGFPFEPQRALLEAATYGQLKFIEWLFRFPQGNSLLGEWEPQLNDMTSPMVAAAKVGQFEAVALIHKLSGILVPVEALSEAAKQSNIEFLKSMTSSLSSRFAEKNVFHGALMGGDEETLEYASALCASVYGNFYLATEPVAGFALVSGSIPALEWLAKMNHPFLTLDELLGFILGRKVLYFLGSLLSVSPRPLLESLKWFLRRGERLEDPSYIQAALEDFGNDEEVLLKLSQC